MDDLFKQLLGRGYTFVERDCVIVNGYADSVQKAVGPAIVEVYDHTRNPDIGPERFFRIDLSKMGLNNTEENTE